MKNYTNLTINEKINYKASSLNKVIATGSQFNIIKRIYQERFDDVCDRVYDYVRSQLYFKTGGLFN
jgi:hypothetical protein